MYVTNGCRGNFKSTASGQTLDCNSENYVYTECTIPGISNDCYVYTEKPNYYVPNVSLSSMSGQEYYASNYSDNNSWISACETACDSNSDCAGFAAGTQCIYKDQSMINDYLQPDSKGTNTYLKGEKSIILSSYSSIGFIKFFNRIFYEFKK